MSYEAEMADAANNHGQDNHPVDWRQPTIFLGTILFGEVVVTQEP